MEEEDKKKKKNKKKKKKKGKQSKNSVEVAHSEEEEEEEEEDTNVRHLAEASQSHHPNLETDRIHAAEAAAAAAAVVRKEAEKQLWLQREVDLEKKIRDLQLEKDAWFQKEAYLEKKIRDSQNEKDAWLQKEVDLEKKIRDLQLEKDVWFQKEADLEKKIRDSQHEKDVWFQKEAGLEKKIRDLQHEKDVWFQKEVSMEEKIKQLFHEKSNWLLKEAQFVERMEQLERERASWVSEEKSIKETITKLNELNTDAIMQVKVLQESRDTVFQENQQLVGAISALQSQVQQLESSSSASSVEKTNISEVEDFKAQLEAAGMLVVVEKLIVENAELVEKVNELCIELNRRSKVLDDSSTAVPDDFVLVISQTMPNRSNGDDVSEFQEKMLRSGKTLEYQSTLETKKENIDVDHTNNETITLEGIPNEDSVRSYEAGDREEIVQMSLDENEIKEVEALAAEADAKEGVTLSDAPLTGAPFRLISFVARYVSGADLVDDKKTLNSSR